MVMRTLSSMWRRSSANVQGRVLNKALSTTSVSADGVGVSHQTTLHCFPIHAHIDPKDVLPWRGGDHLNLL